jgi:hypothetical protein
MAPELQLQSPYLAGGVERVSWWNGRVLTAEDLSDQQRATDQADRRLGRVAGPGVARGLLVTRGPDRRSVEVTDGLAVDRAGEVLELAVPVVVHLVTPPEQDPVRPADFVVCGQTPSVSSAGTGAYLLTIASAAGPRGSAPGAPVHGVETTGCGPRYQVAGVQFRLLELDVAGLAAAGGHDEDDLAVLATLGGTQRHPRLRNVVASVLLDTVVRRRAVLDPFGGPGSYTPALERLASDGALSACEVPLAVVAWAGDGIDFVDGWAVRRPPSSAPAAWPSVFVGPRAGDTGLASLLQFAAHLVELAGPAVPEAVRAVLEARERFRYLPAATLVPLLGAGGQQGVDLGVFTAGLQVRREPIAPGRVWPLVHASLLAPAVDLDGGGLLRAYTVEEAAAASDVQPYVVLAADHLRHLAVAPPDDSDRLVITGVSPPGDHQIGAEITVHGRNFALPPSRNVVTVGGVRVLTFNAGTGPSALVLDVPRVPDPPRVVPLVVSNDFGTADWLISVVERVTVPEGEISMAEDFGELAGQVIARGATFVFWWRVRALTDIAATYRFRPLLTGSTGATDAAWASGAAVVDTSGAERDQFELEPADPDDPSSGVVRVGVRLKVPVRATSVDLALGCEYPPAPGDPGLNRLSSPVAVVAGEELAISDPRIRFSPPHLTVGGVVADHDGALVVPVFRHVQLTVVARFEEGGEFRFEAGVEPPARDLWVLTDPQPDPADTVRARDGQMVSYSVTLLARREDLHPARRLRVRVARVGRVFETYQSFIRFRLRAGR